MQGYFNVWTYVRKHAPVQITFPRYRCTFVYTVYTVYTTVYCILPVWHTQEQLEEAFFRSQPVYLKQLCDVVATRWVCSLGCDRNTIDLLSWSVPFAAQCV